MSRVVPEAPELWTLFRMDGRDFEWRVSGDAPRALEVRSADGKFAVRAAVCDDAYGSDRGRVVASLIGPPTSTGDEFPPGRPRSEWPHRVGGNGFEFARYGVIHTELVRSLLGRWAYRRWHRSPRSG